MKPNLNFEIKRYLFMVLGCICYSLSLQMFLIPNEIVGGGVSGAASLIEIVTTLPAGLFIVLLNLPILIMGLKMMGLKFILRCFLTTAVLGGFTELFSHVPNIGTLTDDGILSAMYGGILQGIGIGCFIKYEVSSGGTELLGRITFKFLPFFSIATHVAILDGLVVVLGAIVLKNPENILYALILIFVSAKVSDMLIMGFNKEKLCYVITNKENEISDFLLTHSPRGITLLQGEGMYTHTPKGVLLTCIKGNQLSQLKNVVKSIDENAFVIVTDANEVYGKGFNRI